MSGHGWQLVVDWRALGAAERELLIGELWCHPVSGIEERDDDLVAGFATEGEARTAASELGLSSTIVEVLDDAYLDEWRQFARPWLVDKLFVRPSWIDAVPPQVPALKGRSGPLPALKGRSGPLPALKGRSGPLPALKGRSGHWRDCVSSSWPRRARVLRGSCSRSTARR